MKFIVPQKKNGKYKKDQKRSKRSNESRRTGTVRFTDKKLKKGSTYYYKSQERTKKQPHLKYMEIIQPQKK